jgi:NADPH:quinone reductase-like Zn-dependent oxidoreductase
MDVTQVWITGAGGPDKLQTRTGRLDPPGAGEVQVAVAAAGINFADILARQGLYPDSPPLPCVVGYEVAGTVAEVGDGVEDLEVGQAVLALTRFGGHSSGINVPAAQVFPRPGSLSEAEAASIPVAYLTAWQLLVVQGGLREGDTVLVQNAGSGVGLAALDVARHVGARTIGTASSGKHDFLVARGLDHAVDYRTGDWTREVRDLTDGRGVDLVVDPLGGESFRKSRTVLRSTGRLGMYGVSAASSNQGLRGKLQLARTAALMPIFHPVALMNQNSGAFGVNLGHMWHEADRLRGWMAEIIDGVDAGWVRPHVDSSWSFAQAAEAHQHIEARRSTGKVVLTP